MYILSQLPMSPFDMKNYIKGKMNYLNEQKLKMLMIVPPRKPFRFYNHV